MLRQGTACIVGGSLQTLLTLLVLPETGKDVVDLQVGGLDCVPQSIDPSAQLGQFRLNGFEFRPLLAGHAVHLLVYEPHEFADVALGEDVVADLLDDEPLEVLRVQAGRLAAPPTSLDEGLADVVGVPAALGFGGRERPPARVA